MEEMSHSSLGEAGSVDDRAAADEPRAADGTHKRMEDCGLNSMSVLIVRCLA